MNKKFYFVINDMYGDNILGIEELTVDMDEVNHPTPNEPGVRGPEYLQKWESKIIYKCKGVKDSDINYCSIARSGIVVDQITEYDSHEMIAWCIFNDEEYEASHFKPDYDPGYDYY